MTLFPLDMPVNHDIHATVEVYISAKASAALRKVQFAYDSSETGLLTSNFIPNLQVPGSNKKAPDRRESTRLVSGSSDGNLRRVKGTQETYILLGHVGSFRLCKTEKSSWLSLSRGSAGLGQWTTATCKLTEEDEGCLLNVYIEVSLGRASEHRRLLIGHRITCYTKWSMFIC